MSEFISQRNRDAWFVIRGYVYQVDLTIQRWLRLHPGEALELERGEDIDQIGQLITSNVDKTVRLLEQVKTRSQSLTLRTPAVREALANFVEHRSSNPNLRLFFRYSTNASIAPERPPLLSSKNPAIQVWQHIREDVLPEDERLIAAQELRNALTALECPEGLNAATWTTFQTFLAEAEIEQILDLIQSFEWSTGTPDPQDMAVLLQQCLLELEYARDESHARTQYERLFLYVFKLLSKPGQKWLTIESLQEQLTLPDLTDDDRTLFAHVQSQLLNLENRVGIVEEKLVQQAHNVLEHEARLQEHSAVLGIAQAQVQHLLHMHGLDPTFTFSFTAPSLDVPYDTLVLHLSRREESIENLITVTANHTWTAISGGVGTGKTHLAVLLAQEWPHSVIWIRFGNLSTTQAIVRLDAAIGVIANNTRNSWRQSYQEACKRLNSQTLIVLDDLPVIISGDELNERLIHLCQTCHAYDVRLISTGHHRLPTTVQQSLHETLLAIVDIPPLTLSETRDILKELGAPVDRLTEAFLKLVNALTHGHPTLLTAYGMHQRSQGWPGGTQWFDDLVHKTYTSELHEQTVRRLLESVIDRETRELLYRLKLIDSSFSLVEVRTLAGIDPPIPHAVERLQTLRGLWIQGNSTDRLLLSPLIKALEEGDLVPQTARICHGALGDLLVQTRQLNPLDVLLVHNHYIAAEEWDKAGVFVLAMLLEMNTLEPPFDDHAFSLLYETKQLPTRMNLGLRIAIRAAQIALRHKRGTSLTQLPQELDALITQASETDSWSILSAAVLTYDALSQHNFAQATHYMALAQKAWPQGGTFTLPNGQSVPVETPPNVSPHSFLWWCVPTITSITDTHIWLNSFEQLTHDERQMVLADELAHDMSIVLANRLWLIEGDKLQGEQDWPKVLSNIHEIAERAKQLKIEVLWAAAIRAEIITLGEYLHDLQGAVQVAETALQEASTDPGIRFLITSSIGLQFAYVNRHREAVVWLREAAEYVTVAFPEERIRMLLYLSRAVAEDSVDGDTALSYAQQAVTFADTIPDISEIDRIKALGELGIAYWLSDDVDAAFRCFDRAAERLVLSEHTETQWQELFVIFANTLSQLATLSNQHLSSDEVLAITAGSTIRRGMFLIHYHQAPALYNPTNHDLLAAMMAKFAEAVGQTDKAVTWAWRAIDQATPTRRQQLIGGLGHMLVADLLLQDRYETAIGVGQEFGIAHVIASAMARSDYKTAQTDPTHELDVLSSSEQQMAQQRGLLFVVIPAVFRLAILSFDNPTRLASAVTDLTRTCRTHAATATDPILWSAVADIVDAIFVHKLGATQLMREGVDSQKESLFRTLYLLGSILQDDVVYTNAVFAQLLFLPFVSEEFGYRSMIYQHTVAPFIYTYWQTMFRRARFRFALPKIVEEQLNAAIHVPVERRVQYILQSISDGLTLKLSPSLSNWLRE